MIKWLLYNLLFVCSNVLLAQNILVPTQHQFNRLTYNPAYAGIKDGVNTSSLVRDQKIENQSIAYRAVSIDMPVKFYSMGVGLVIENQQQEIQDILTIKGACSYKIKVNSGVLSLGVDAGIEQYKVGLNQLAIQHETDPTLASGQQVVPYMSAGLFYQKERYFAGVSVNRLFTSSIHYSSDSLQSNTVRRVTLLGGYNFELSSAWNIRSSVMTDVLVDQPLLSYLSVLSDYKKKYWFGFGYRLQTEYAVIAGLNFSRLVSGFTLPLKLGVSYNLPLDNGVFVSNGLEFMVSYSYEKRPNAEKIRNGKRIVSPIIFY